MKEKEYKIYVKVGVYFLEDGTMMPTQIYWRDGRVFEIDKIIDVRKAASLKAGGCGIRYSVKINGKYKYLFYEEPRWFVEGK